MIVYLDLEHPALAECDPPRWERSQANLLRTKARLEAISGSSCRIVHYLHLVRSGAASIEPKALVLSGCYTDYQEYDPADLAVLRDFIRKASMPVLGFCAGFQQMAQAFGGRIDAIGDLPPGAADLALLNADQFGVGRQQERGFLEIENQRPDHPLMRGLSPRPIFFQAHYWEVKEAPPEFEVLASSRMSPIQVLAHPDRPIAGTQFHAEAYTDEHPAGRLLIENFFASYVRP